MMDEDDDKMPIVDNSMTVINKIANLYAERLMSDVCLVVGNSEFPSHRLILCASSDVFQVMLMNPRWTESMETRVVLIETPSCSAVFEDFLKYFYTGKIKLNYFSVIPLMSLADKYNVKDLLRLGLDYMSRNVSTACKKNQVVAWYRFAVASGHESVANLCKNFIKWNFKTVSTTVDFPQLEVDLLIGFLQCNDLVIEDEMTLFKCVFTWLTAKRNMMIAAGEEHIDLHMSHLISLVIPQIRFPMMTPSQLADLLLNPLSTTHMEILVENMRIAMCYHKDQMQSNMIRNDGDKLFTPRLYTTEHFCASLSVDYLHNLRPYHCRSLLFSSQKFMAEYLGLDDQLEWVVDLYPKGVWFQKCFTVYKPPQVEVPECVLKTVRVSISTRSEEEIRVRIGILLIGVKDDYEHIRKVSTRNYFFSKDDQIVNFDDLVDYDDLNDFKHNSPFLSGQSFKILIVITPLSKISSLE